MIFTDSKPLKILNASAGSGKTYNLVKEYILLLISDEKDTMRFKRIIAMTFTNKAAIEMKTRIIKALDELSYPEKYKIPSEKYAKLLGTELGITHFEVHLRSKKVLQNILHRYEDFFVMTIDKFNLKLIRSFSRDLDLPNDFDVILNEAEVIEQVVDLILSQLGKADYESLTKKVFEYAKDNLDDGEKWNFRDQLVEFGSVLTKEKNHVVLNKLLELDFSISRNKELRLDLKSQTDKFISECQLVHELYLQFNIPQDLYPGKSGTTNPIEKLSGLSDLPPKFLTDTLIKNASVDPPKGREFPSELREAILELKKNYDLVAPKIFLQKAFLNNFYNMAMLQYMAISLESIKKDEQLIRISEFNKLISDLVRNEDAPFIYERLGIRFQHFLLDEFQDTSRLQWLNMVPLMRESLSNQNKNLIVGDPKQSIYRFKNGVAEQFVSLPRIYNPENDKLINEKSLYFDKMGHVLSLDDNWRSSPEIVNFNNELFPFVKEFLPETSKEFYNSIHQNAQSELVGLVDVVSSESEIEDLDLIPLIISRIEQCEKDGFKRGDICILSDANFRANTWAVELTKKDYKVVSAESLLVQNEVKVKLIISYLKRRLNPSSESEKRRFAEMYFQINKKDSFRMYRGYFEKRINSAGKEFAFFKDDEFITDQFGGKTNFFFKYENLYDLIQSFFKLMKWDELKNPYLHHFADFAHEFELTKGPDIKSFLSHYNSHKSKLAIQLPESDDAIKIMTIHKSKGLEFPVVILPFIDFSIATKSKFLIEIKDLILYSSLSKDSLIPEVVDFRSYEMNQILTDKVNQCYVAFTRPMERLYILNHFKKGSFGAIMHECFNKLSVAKKEETGELKIQIGKSSKRLEQESENKSSFFEPKSISENLWFPDISIQDQKGISENTLLSKEQRFGNQFHIAMAGINDPKKIQNTVDQLVKEGEIEIEFSSTIIQKINSIFNLQAFNQLFKNSKEILNEQTIILDETNIRRPDKLILKEDETIILDYKTGLPSPNDKKQMEEYISILHKMELPQVKGFIFYTYNNELIEF